jgi:mutator protein MutT
MSVPDLAALIARAEGLLARVEAVLPGLLQPPDFAASIAFRYRKRAGAGARGMLEPVRHVAALRLGDLKEVDPQRDRLLRNTAQFVAGVSANNALLTGARGTGKSSLIKACLNEFAPRGLRLIEVDKADLVDLPDIVELIADRPERFIVFCDDLSFEDGEPGYKALKSILDGSVAQATDNLLIYATSNRRHLLPEYMKENLSYQHTEDGEVHPGEGVEEKISLSERFGLWISFYPFSQPQYLAIVAQWLQHFDASLELTDALRAEALVWALERGSRSGRVAYQFAREAAGRLALERQRQPVDVAVGVLIERDASGREGRFLLTSRPAGKVFAGYWEFPGGKLETGETVEAALQRELHEELGIRVGASHPWQVLEMDYPHARVRLHFHKVYDWAGTLEMREGQRMAWESLPVHSHPVLPGTIPVLQWFAAERGHTGPTHLAPEASATSEALQG